MTNNQALTLALEALEAVAIYCDVLLVVKPEGEVYLHPAITAIREAMAQPWVDLSDDDIDRVTDAQWARNNDKPIYAAHRAYARAIETTIKERNL